MKRYFLLCALAISIASCETLKQMPAPASDPAYSDTAQKARIDSLWSALANALSGISTNESVTGAIPVGKVDGINKVFTLPFAPLKDSEGVYVGGILQDRSTYQVQGQNIVFTAAAPTKPVVVNYWHP